MQMTRRGWMSASAGFGLYACERKKGSGFPGYALIATAGETSLAVVDLSLFRFTKAIPLKATPTSVRSGILPGQPTYVLTPSNGTIHQIDSDLRVLRSVRLADHLSAMQLTPDGRLLAVLAAGSAEVLVVDAKSFEQRARFRLQGEPAFLDTGPGGKIVVSTGAHGVIELFDLRRGLRQAARFEGTLGAVCFRKDGELVLASNYQERSLIALDGTTLATVAELPLAMHPDNLCFSFDRGQLFISGNGMDGVAIVFPYNTLEVEQTVLAGRAPGAMACSNQPGYLFVASRNGSDVCVLNMETRKMIGVTQVGEAPRHIAVTPDDQYALILDEGTGDMAVMHIPEIHWSRSKPSAPLFTLIEVGSRPVEAAIVQQA